MGLQILYLAIIILFSLMESSPIAALVNQSQCHRECGDQIVPYPFGLLGDSKECFKNSSYMLFCNRTHHNPPKLFLYNGSSTLNEFEIPILNISVANSTAIVQLPTAVTCYDKSGNKSFDFKPQVYLGPDSPFTFSADLNKFVAIGCHTYGLLGYGSNDFSTGCVVMCDNTTTIPGRLNITQSARPSSAKFGCCQTEVPRGNNHIYININVDMNSRSRPRDLFASNPCDYSYLAVAPKFSLKMSQKGYLYSDVAVDWAIGENCEKATSGDGVSKPSNCGTNTLCTNSENGPGYICRCKEGYKDNPYIGCTDINECETDQHPCQEGSCKNTPGSYTCECPFGQEGDGKVGCSINTASKIMIGIGGTLLSAILIVYLYKTMHKKIIKEKNHRKNGGLLLKHLSVKNFKETVLQKATNNFDAQQLLGEGGNGWVYKGSVEGMIDIAIKKSKVLDQNQIEQFLNEVDVVSKINHKNVVKLMGVCLESKVPMLVYEFVPNGTLCHHIHEASSSIVSSWHICLKIIAEVARALDYMHSQADPPIIHRDVKPSNILLDGTYTAKVSDFGASKLIRLDHSMATTKGQGTMGYFDPEYFQTGQLTTKSDVYGFGIVLMELLTKHKPLSQGRYGEMISIVQTFASALEENQLDQILKVEVANERESEQVYLVAKLAVKCVAGSSNDRPTMTEVADVLNGLRKEYYTFQVEGNRDSSDELVSFLDDQDFVRTKLQFEVEQSSS